MKSSHGTTIFIGKSDKYSLYRSHYPKELYEFLDERLNIKIEDVIVDIGSGTGIFSLHFVERGHQLYAVEPNDEMRKYAEELLHPWSNFKSINGTGEFTGLPTCSADFIMMAQTVHWLDPLEARKEFLRIARPGAYLVIVLKVQRKEDTVFHDQLAKILEKYGIASRSNGNKELINRLTTLYGKNNFNLSSMVFSDFLDLETFKGRIASRAYAPHPSAPKYRELIEELEIVFNVSTNNNQICINYDLVVVWGELA